MDSEIFTRSHFKEVLHALHTDQSGLEAALKRVLKVIDGYEWIRECRGCYEWDDDRYMEEIGRCFDAMRDVIDPALNKASDAHRICCGTYRNYNDLPKSPVQYGMNPGETYDQFADRIMKVMSLQGVIE
jgi:hypothetical protein